MTELSAPGPSVRLLNGVDMPRLGLGTWPMDDAQSAAAVRSALDVGYRLIDTAENYRNEAGVGEGVRTSGVAREEIFVTTKFNREWHSVDGVREACEASLKRLKMDYVDLLLIHWPNPEQNRYLEAFEGMARLIEAGLTRSIGVSNFKPAHLQRLLDAGFTPHVNQIQLDPWHRRDDIVALHQAHGVVTESWSPVGRGRELLGDPTISEIAQTHGKTPAQVVLRWHVQSGYVPVPKSADPGRQAENLNVFGFSLSPADMVRLDAMNRPDLAPIDADKVGH